MLVSRVHRFIQSAPAVDAEPLEASELKLHRDALVADRGNYEPAVSRNRRSGTACRSGAAARGLERPGPEIGRIGVEAEDELTFPLLNERGEPVAERLSVLADQPPLTVCLSFAPAENRGTLLAAIWMRSPVCGLTP